MTTVTLQLDAAALQYRTEVRPAPCTDGSIVYVAEIPDLPGCMSHGATVDEARQNLEDAKREYLAALQERGLPVPAPSSEPAVTSVIWTVIGPVEAVEDVTAPEIPTGTVRPLVRSETVTSV